MDNQIPWYNPHWLYPSTLKGFDTWDMKFFLWGVVAIGIFFLLKVVFQVVLGYRFNRKLPVALTQTEFKSSPFNIIRFLPDLVFIAMLSFIFVALARPQNVEPKTDAYSEGIDIILAIDVSPSMEFLDLSPNRLEAAKKVASEFIEGRKGDRIGLVVFSVGAFSLAPLTTDYAILHDYIEQEIKSEMFSDNGTAIGSALTVVTNRMKDSESKTKVCILISDGDNTAGNIDPLTAINIAAATGIKVYTILIGKKGKVPVGKDRFGITRYYENTIDETTMRKIAEIGNGEFFRAGNEKALRNIFETIDAYEKTEVTETKFVNTIDYYFIYLYWALALFLIWLFTKSTFISNVLQD